VAEEGPGVAGEEFDEVLFDADGVAEGGEAEALGEAADMGIDDDAFIFLEGVSEDDIGGFASGTGEVGEGFEGGWHFAAVLREECGTHGSDVFGFVAIEAGGADEGFEFLLRDGGVIGSGAAAREEVFGDDINPFIGALGGEDGGDEEFECVRVVELAVGVGVDGREPFEKLPSHAGCAGGFFRLSAGRSGGAGHADQLVPSAWRRCLACSAYLSLGKSFTIWL